MLVSFRHDDMREKYVGIDMDVGCSRLHSYSQTDEAMVRLDTSSGG